MKHSAPPPNLSLPPPPDNHKVEGAVTVSEGDVACAICSFPKGLPGSLDGLRPQHLLDLTSTSAGMGGEPLCTLTVLTNLILAGAGDFPSEVRPIFFGASLIALNKKGGVVRPIAVGCTLCRLIAKIASKVIMECMGSLLVPIQLGYVTTLGAEAAVHAARLYLTDLQPDYVILKLDFNNVFNSVRREKVLKLQDSLPRKYFHFSTPAILSLHPQLSRHCSPVC